ncbi:MAG: TIGR02301 family protein [Methylobacteriaceae bacterium]|nr:TIGR02301 family protein [Methylobacteriaceae bacterium]
MPSSRSVSFLFAPAVWLLCAALTAAPAQTARKGAPPPKDKETVKAIEATSYDKELFRLSELVGSLAYLHSICSEMQLFPWTSSMRTLVDAESGQSAKRRGTIIGAYNRGYRNYALTYRHCTPQGQAVIRNFTAEAEKLSRRLANRYGG